MICKSEEFFGGMGKGQGLGAFVDSCLVFCFVILVKGVGMVIDLVRWHKRLPLDGTFFNKYFEIWF